MNHLDPLIKNDSQKKILALDGGGIRGIITLEILAEIENLLRKKSENTEQFVLANYFDFVSGTSTGAIIAACISAGMSVKNITKFYEKSGEQMFDKAFVLNRFRYKYDDDNLAVLLQDVMHKELKGDTTLGSKHLKTLLMMVMRNATTDSPWSIWNNPYAKYNDRSRDDCNLNLPMWQLIRASTAAPTYFPPQVVKIGPKEDKEFIFVDGGITPYNNPAFQTFLMATIEPHKLQWATGEDKMLIVSVGTGTSPDANKNLAPSEMNLMYNATSLPSALMFAALNEQDTLCRIFGKCLVGEPLDNDIGTLINSKGPIDKKMFTYIRYNAELSTEGLNNLGLNDINPKDVQKLDAVEHIEKLKKVGKAVAEKQINIKHFESF